MELGETLKIRLLQYLEIPRFDEILLPLYPRLLREELRGCYTVLDLGCGPKSPIAEVPWIKYSVGVDAFPGYIAKSRRLGIHSEYILGDVTKMEFKPRSFDAVMALDLLEHLPKKEGKKLLSKMEKWARKKVIVFVPNGFVHQDPYDHNELQRHVSGWTLEEFKRRGYRVYGINGIKWLRTERARIRLKPERLWYKVSFISEKILYKFPKLSFQLLCVKEIINKNK